jgi:hypothetical protein
MLMESAVKTMMTVRAAKSCFFICVFTRESHLAFCLLDASGARANYINTYSNISNDFSKSYPT